VGQGHPGGQHQSGVDRCTRTIPINFVHESRGCIGVPRGEARLFHRVSNFLTRQHAAFEDDAVAQ
jgi:hypothetical protein